LAAKPDRTKIPIRMAQVHSITTAAVEKFIARWNDTEAAERANYVAFLTEFCRVLGWTSRRRAAVVSVNIASSGT